MRIGQKRVLWSISVLALVLIVAVFAADRLTDRAHLEELARAKVQQAWSRQLTIGSLALRLLPYPQLSATKVTISNPAWAQDRHLLEAETVTARLALLPLLTGKVVVKGLYFDGVKIYLDVAKDGTRSWDLPKMQKTSASPIDLTALRAQNSSLVFRDGASEPLTWQVQNLRAYGDSDLRNVSFNINVSHDNHLLQLDGKLRDLSAFGTENAISAGTINLKSGQASASVSGNLPLDIGLRNYDITAAIDAASMQEAYGFFGITRRVPVALKGGFAIHASGNKTEMTNLKLQLGQLNLSGDGQLDRSGTKPLFNLRLQVDHVDMIQTFLDIGQPPLPPKKEGQLFHDKPLAWPLLVKLDGTEGKVEASIASLRLRSGIEVTNAAAHFAFNDDRMTVSPFSGKLLGGTASGDAFFEGRKKAVRLNLQLTDTSLAQWFEQTRKKIVLIGGPMKVDASISTAGASMNDLAAAITGPINIQIGPTKILSPKAGHAEFWFTGLFSAKGSDQVDLACISARLPFRSGIARGDAIAGARSDASQLLTSGAVDLREQTLDLNGRIRARSGANLGISTLAGDVKISGKIVKPKMNMGASGIAGTVARVGAAIITSGASIVATSIWDGANPELDPCRVVFSTKAQAVKDMPQRQSAH